MRHYVMSLRNMRGSRKFCQKGSNTDIVFFFFFFFFFFVDGMERGSKCH